MKKGLALILAIGMIVCILGGCARTKDEAVAPPDDVAQPAPEMPETEREAYKTGLAVIAKADKSLGAGEEDGLAQADVLLVAVLLGGDGRIVDCKIDGVQAKINFSAAGKLVTPAQTMFESKNELGEAYGMKKASDIGKEWNEQAAAFAAYVVGKTADEVAGIAMTDGKATDTDLAASVTISIGDFVTAVQKAAANAQELGAGAGDTLALASTTEMSSSSDAQAEAAGLAQANVTVTATTFSGETITSCMIDGVQVNVEFDQSGKLTSDITGAFLTKDELGEAYGMKKASGIGKEWNEQAQAFAQYVVGKTAAQVQDIAVREGRPSDADLASSVTIHIGVFQSLLQKAAQ